MPPERASSRPAIRLLVATSLAIGLVAGLTGTVAIAAPFDTGSLSGPDFGSSLSGSSTPSEAASGIWETNPVAFTAAEGSIRTFALPWHPQGIPQGTLKATISSPLAEVANLDFELVTQTESGSIEFPIVVTMPPAAAGEYTGTVQLTDDGGALGPELHVTVTTDFGDANQIPTDLTQPSPERIVTFDTYERIGDELLVTVDPAGDQEGVIRSAAAETGATIYGADPSIGLYQLRYRGKSPEEVEQLKPMVQIRPGIVDAISNYIGYSDALPNDSNLKWESENEANWGLKQIDAPGAWDELGGGGNSKVKVGIIDAGPVYDYHEDLVTTMALSPRIGSNRDYLSIDHPSHVAGIACATGNNGRGITGVAQRCDMRDYFYPDAWVNGSVPLAMLTKEMRSAGRDEARVVNISLGYHPKTFSRPYECKSGNEANPSVHTKDEFQRELARVIKDYPDTLWVTSAGNACVNVGNSFPAAMAGYSDRVVADRVVAVAASNKNVNWASYSNYGDGITVAAPGGENVNGGRIISTVPSCTSNFWHTPSCTSTYTGKAGTSMSAPYVTGTAALAYSAKMTVSPEDVKRCLVEGAKKGKKSISRPGDSRTYDVLNAAQTVVCIKGSGAVTTPPTTTPPPATEPPVENLPSEDCERQIAGKDYFVLCMVVRQGFPIRSDPPNFLEFAANLEKIYNESLTPGGVDTLKSLGVEIADCGVQKVCKLMGTPSADPGIYPFEMEYTSPTTGHHVVSWYIQIVA